MLYQQINNEALDEDRKADLEVIRRLKKNYEENKQAVQQRRRLDPIQKNAFLKELALFEKYIFKTEAFLETTGVFGVRIDQREASKLISDIVITYNNLIAFLGKIGYKDMEEDDKNFIKNKIKGNLAAIMRITAGLYERVPDFVILPINNIASDMRLGNYRIQAFTNDPKLEFRRDQARRAQLQREEDERNREVQDDAELFGDEEGEEGDEDEESAGEGRPPVKTTLREAIEDYALVNPNERLDTQRAYDDISMSLIRQPNERQYMRALSRIRPTTNTARRAREVARAQRQVDRFARRQVKNIEGAEDEFL
jgi:hypothetical protein